MKIKITHLGIEAEGETVGKAKAAAAVIAERVVSASIQGPMMFTVGSLKPWLVIITETPFGFNTTWYNGEYTAGVNGGRSTKEEAVCSAIHHILTQILEAGADMNTIGFCVDACHFSDSWRKTSKVIKNQEQRDRLVKDIYGYLQWQKQYKDAVAEGKTEEEARLIASKVA